MSTPTKPERVEVGSRWKTCGGGCIGEIVALDGQYATFRWRYVDGHGSPWENRWTLNSYAKWDCIYLGPAPATPGTATVSPGPTVEAAKARWREARGLDASLAPKPYGRLVGELRAPDGTPRTALEAIQAKREPEPWRPAVDEWDLLPDVDVRR